MFWVLWWQREPKTKRSSSQQICRDHTRSFLWRWFTQINAHRFLQVFLFGCMTEVSENSGARKFLPRSLLLFFADNTSTSTELRTTKTFEIHLTPPKKWRKTYLFWNAQLENSRTPYNYCSMPTIPLSMKNWEAIWKDFTNCNLWV